MHLVGFSLGAQVAGYAGQRTPGLGRITGLDPAQPYFEYKDPLVRLDPSDAEFVDVIHTDGNSVLTLGFGLFQPSGHIDFYPNGGKKQPGCATFNNTDGQYHLSTGCDHGRAPSYFFESINGDCEFKAYPCDLWDIDYDPSKCNYCLQGDCAVMGYEADKSGLRGTFYLETNSASPYCTK
ncbi:pancreatic triacylglycerol lipase-like [Ptychodera flava]|uniref:pancreatic triacylglycerol lipase-like n=1 Tax=Ptychodera flava TaxID=63121 RepID=UPI003969DE8A